MKILLTSAGFPSTETAITESQFIPFTEFSSQLPYPKKKFCYVTSSSSWEHSPNQPEFPYDNTAFELVSIAYAIPISGKGAQMYRWNLWSFYPFSLYTRSIFFTSICGISSHGHSSSVGATRISLSASGTSASTHQKIYAQPLTNHCDLSSPPWRNPPPHGWSCLSYTSTAESARSSTSPIATDSSHC